MPPRDDKAMLVRLRLSGPLLELARAATPPGGELAEGVRHLMQEGVHAERTRYDARETSNAVLEVLDAATTTLAEVKAMVWRMDADRQEWQRSITLMIERAASSSPESGTSH